jgi:hypothetical protein
MISNPDDKTSYAIPAITVLSHIPCIYPYLPPSSASRLAIERLWKENKLWTPLSHKWTELALLELGLPLGSVWYPSDFFERIC